MLCYFVKDIKNIIDWEHISVEIDIAVYILEHCSKLLIKIGAADDKMEYFEVYIAI